MKRHFCAVWRQVEKSKILVGRIRVNLSLHLPHHYLHLPLHFLSLHQAGSHPLPFPPPSHGGHLPWSHSDHHCLHPLQHLDWLQCPCPCLEKKFIISCYPLEITCLSFKTICQLDHLKSTKSPNNLPESSDNHLHLSYTVLGSKFWSFFTLPSKGLDPLDVEAFPHNFWAQILFKYGDKYP